MSETSPAGAAMTIDELARQARLPVRTIREYHSMRLLPPPQRHGRVGIYGAVHSQRLELIARLQRRGYSLAGIRDLLQAWDAGADLTSLLGVGPGNTAVDETPLRLSRAELSARLPALSSESLSRACRAGLVQPDGEQFLVRSPALLALVADGVAAGAPLGDLLELAGVVHREIGSLAAALADMIVNRLWPPVRDGRAGADIAPLLQRGRLLLLQGTASTLADRLGAALLERAADDTGGAGLRSALAKIRVGAVADSAGHVERRRDAR